jgi:N6-L-threonylcarbamoyladenine synthase
LSLVLGIETSCDETAAAVVADGRRIVAGRVASRHHLERLDPLVGEVLAEAELVPEALDGVAVTRGPGLVGALMVGVAYAKALAYAARVALVGVNHVLAHVYAAFLAEGLPPRYPTLALVVSGGHTDLLLLSGPTDVRVLGVSRDDAAGEAFDKVARLLGRPYPGGPEVERLARDGEVGRVALPDVRPFPGSLDFSFSGLKTAVAHRVADGARPEDVAAAFQARVAEILARTTAAALRECGAGTLVLAGGVAANGAVRRALQEVAISAGVEFLVPPPALCTDNAAMVAALGDALLREGVRDGLELGAEPVIHPFKP